MPAAPTDFDTPGIGRPPRLMAWVLLAPMLLWLVLFVVVPTVIMIVISFCRRDDLGGVVYDGTLVNYTRMVTPEQVWPMVMSIVAGLLAALLAAASLASYRVRRLLTGRAAMVIPLLACALILAPLLAIDAWQLNRYTHTGAFATAMAPTSPQAARTEFAESYALPLPFSLLCGLFATGVMWSLIAPPQAELPTPRRLAIALGGSVGAGIFWGVLNAIVLVHVRSEQFAGMPLVIVATGAQMLKIFVVSVNYAAFATAICAVVGYPVAFFIGKASDRWRNLLLMLVMIPFWTSFLVRTYAWVTILRTEGVLNATLLHFGLISDPLDLYPSQFGVMIGLVYTYLPFMILPIYTSIERLDNALVEAAFDLGASPVRAFNSVIFPLTKPGVVAGILLVFVPAIGMFAVNDILGGKNEMLIGNVIERQFTSARDKPFGAALGMLLLLVFVATYYLTTRRREA